MSGNSGAANAVSTIVGQTCIGELWFRIIVLIVALLASALFITNIIFYGKIRTNGGCGKVTASQATAMLWLNGLLLAFALVLLIWAIIRLAVGKSKRDQISNLVDAIGRQENFGFVSGNFTPSVQQQYNALLGRPVAGVPVR